MQYYSNRKNISQLKMIKTFDKNMTAYDGIVRAHIFTSCSDKIS